MEKEKQGPSSSDLKIKLKKLWHQFNQPVNFEFVKKRLSKLSFQPTSQPINQSPDIELSPKAKQITVSIILAIFIIIGILGTIFLGYTLVFGSKIYPRILAAGINLGGKDKAEALKLLQQKVKILENQKVEIVWEKEVFRPTFAELGVSFDPFKTADLAWQIGRNDNFIQAIFEQIKAPFSATFLDLSPKIDEKKVNVFFDELSKKINREPKNAGLKIESGNVKIIPSQEGQKLDLEIAKKDLMKVLSSGKTGKVILKVAKIPPTISDEKTKEPKALAEKWLGASGTIIAKFPDNHEEAFSFGRTQIGSWILFSEKDNLLIASLSDSAIVNFVASIARKTDVLPVSTQILNTGGQKVVIREGKPGLALDQKGIAQQIKRIVLAASSGTITANVAQIPPGVEEIGECSPGRFAGKYIEVVISKQTLCAYEGENLVLRSGVSTGRSTMPTPLGMFSILAKRGTVACNPSPTEYRTCYMPYSLMFTTAGHHIHELPIIDGVREGLWDIGRQVSHGCVRLPPGPAATIYNWADVGIPVYIHN